MRNLHQLFDWQCIGQIIGGDFAKFCGLLRIYELYVVVVSTAILVGVLELTITAVYQYPDMNTYYGVLQYWLRSFKLDFNTKFF